MIQVSEGHRRTKVCVVSFIAVGTDAKSKPAVDYQNLAPGLNTIVQLFLPLVSDLICSSLRGHTRRIPKNFEQDSGYLLSGISRWQCLSFTLVWASEKR